MIVKIKKLNSLASIPKYAKEGDAGLDLVAITKSVDDFGNIVYGFGLALEIPLGYVGLLFPRSSINKYTLELTNSVGVIDCGYRGEIMVKFKQTYSSLPQVEYEIGDKVVQLIIMPHPSIEFEVVERLSSSERGSGGYGSSGN